MPRAQAQAAGSPVHFPGQWGVVCLSRLQCGGSWPSRRWCRAGIRWHLAESCGGDVGAGLSAHFGDGGRSPGG